MWQEGVMMAGLNVGDVIRELDISRSYLYKLIDKENVLIPRSETGRSAEQDWLCSSKRYALFWYG